MHIQIMFIIYLLLREWFEIYNWKYESDRMHTLKFIKQLMIYTVLASKDSFTHP